MCTLNEKAAVLGRAKDNHNRHFLRIKKLVGRDIIRAAAKHNLREIPAETGAGGHIDPTRTCLNEVIAGGATAAEVVSRAEDLVKDAGVGKLRRDAVRGVEIVVSLPATQTIDSADFFTASLVWVRRFFNVPVLSAVAHRDEAATHCHVLLLPLVGGRMVGSALVGNRKRLMAMHSSFYEEVGLRFGMARPKETPRLSSTDRHIAASMILTSIQSHPELMDKPDVEEELLVALRRDPVPLLEKLNLTLPDTKARTRTFTQIMIKPCRPEKPVETEHAAT